MRVEEEKFKVACGFDSEHDFLALLDLKWGGEGSIFGDVAVGEEYFLKERFDKSFQEV